MPRPLDFVNIGLSIVSISALAATFYLRRKDDIETDDGVLLYAQAFENHDPDMLWASFGNRLREGFEASPDVKAAQLGILPDAKKKGISFRDAQLMGGYKSPNGPGYFILKMKRFLDGKFIGEIVWILLTDEDGKLSAIVV